MLLSSIFKPVISHFFAFCFADLCSFYHNSYCGEYLLVIFGSMININVLSIDYFFILIFLLTGY